MGAMTMLLLAANMATAPVPLDFQNLMTSDDYPTDSLLKNDEGVVRFAVTISPDGNPAACAVAQGSGSEFLDATTCSLVMARAHFKAAQDDKGKPIVAVYRANLRWQLPTDDAAPAADAPPPKPRQPTKYDLALTVKKLPDGAANPAGMSLVLIVSDKGKIENCWSGVASTLPANVQKDACKQVTAQLKPTPATDAAGAAVRSIQTANVTLTAAAGK